MRSNFEFLQSNLRDDAVQTEANPLAAPRTCAFYARRTLERMVKCMYAHGGYLPNRAEITEGSK